MELGKNIVWLASYPKSGNTWLRSILVHLLYPEQEYKDLQYLKSIGYVSNRRLFDEYLGIDSSDLGEQEIELLRPEVYDTMAAQTKENLYLKIHDAYQTLSNGKALVSQQASKAVLYIVRNPLDVAVSYSAFTTDSVDTTIKQMNDSNFKLSSSQYSLKMEICQHLSSWSSHVASWTEQKDIPILSIRYEDLTDDTVKVIKMVVKFLGLSFSNQQIKLAIDNSSFKKLQKLEESYGYLEKHSNCNSFFRNGRVGEGIETLTKDQILEIKSNHKKMMKHLGYL